MFVPSAPCKIFPAMKRPVDCSNPAPLLVDCFEVTRGEWLSWLELQTEESEAQTATSFWAGEESRHPATGMLLAEAMQFAADQGMRIPTAREWLRVAIGTRAQPFPWGPVPQSSVANTGELGLERLAAVGTFEAGCTPAGVYDLLGNAAEWVLKIDVREAAAGADARTWAMGGSYLSRLQSTFSFDEEAERKVAYNASLLDPLSRSNDVGLRLVADAEEWIRAQAPSWPTDAASLRRLQQVGQSWGVPAVPLLKKLSAESRENVALAALLRGAQS